METQDDTNQRPSWLNTTHYDQIAMAVRRTNLLLGNKLFNWGTLTTIHEPDAVQLWASGAVD